MPEPSPTARRRMRRFLDHLADTGNVSAACRLARLDRRTAYQWRAADADFRRQWQEALEALKDAAAEADRLLALHGVRRDLIEFELPVAAYFKAGAPWLGDEIAYRDDCFLDYAEGRPLILLGVEEDYTADRITLQAWG